MGRYEKSLECYQCCMDICKNSPKECLKVLNKMANIYCLLQKFDQAKAFYEQVALNSAQTQRKAKSLRKIASLYSMGYIGQTHQAVDYLNQATLYDSRGSESWFEFGKHYISKSINIPAYKTLEFSTSLQPLNARYWITVGKLYLKFSQDSECLISLCRAIEIDPNQSETWFLIANLFHTIYEKTLCQRTYLRAYRAYQWAVKIDQESQSVQQKLVAMSKINKNTNNGQTTDSCLHILKSLNKSNHLQDTSQENEPNSRPLKRRKNALKEEKSKILLQITDDDQ